MPHYHLFHLHLHNCPNPAKLGYSTSREGMACMEARLGRVHKAVDLVCYRHAAVVEATNLLDLYQKTGAAGDDWIHGRDIQPIAGAQRATSFGDIVIDVDTGQAHSVWRGGWKEQPIEACASLFLASYCHTVVEQLEAEPQPEPEDAWEAVAL